MLHTFGQPSILISQVERQHMVYFHSFLWCIAYPNPNFICLPIKMASETVEGFILVTCALRLPFMRSFRSQIHTFIIYRPPTIHLPSTYRPRTDHLPTTYQPLTNHIPTTYQPHTNHLPTTYRPHTNHIPTTFFLRCSLFNITCTHLFVSGCYSVTSSSY